MQWKPDVSEDVDFYFEGDLREIKHERLEENERISINVETDSNDNLENIIVSDSLGAENGLNSPRRSLPPSKVIEYGDDFVVFEEKGEYANPYDIDINDITIIERYNSISRKIKIDFDVTANDLTNLLLDIKNGNKSLDSLDRNYIFKGGRPSDYIKELRKELLDIPIKNIDKGDISEDVIELGRDIEENGISENLTLTVTLYKEHEGLSKAKFQTGRSSISWSVSSSTNWQDNESISEGTYAEEGTLKMGEFVSRRNYWIDKGGSVYAYIENVENYEGEPDDTYAHYWGGDGWSSWVRFGGAIPSSDSPANPEEIVYWGYADYSNDIYIRDIWVSSDDTSLNSEASGDNQIFTNGQHWLSTSDSAHVESVPDGQNVQSFQVELSIGDGTTGGEDGYNDAIELRYSSGTWTSSIWDSGASSKQMLDSFETNCSVGSSEDIVVRIGVDEDDDGTIETWSHSSGNGVSLSDGTNTLEESDFGGLPDGYRYQIEYQLSVSDSDYSHTPTVSDYTLTTVDSGVTLSGTVTIDGSTYSGVYVYAWNKTDSKFEGWTTTSSDGSYSLLVGSGDEILVGIDYYDGSKYYGDKKSITMS